MYKIESGGLQRSLTVICGVCLKYTMDDTLDTASLAPSPHNSKATREAVAKKY